MDADGKHLLTSPPAAGSLEKALPRVPLLQTKLKDIHFLLLPVKTSFFLA